MVEQISYMLTLNTSDQNFGTGGLVDELGSFRMDGCQLDTHDRATLVNGIAGNVHDTTQRSWTNRDHDGITGIEARFTTDKTLSAYTGC